MALQPFDTDNKLVMVTRGKQNTVCAYMGVFIVLLVSFLAKGICKRLIDSL